MNYVINLSKSNEYNAIFTIVNRLTKKRYYVLYIAIEKKILLKLTTNILIKKIFRIYKLLVFIISNRDL